MRASLSLSSLAVAASAATLLIALPSRAQVPPAPQAQAGFAPYAPQAAPQPWEAPPPRAVRNSPNMVIAGAVLIGAGSVGAVIGASLLAAGTSYRWVDDPTCNFDTFECGSRQNEPGKTKAGAALTAISTVALVVGIPVFAVGRRMVPTHPEAALVPEVRVGAGAATLRWSF